MYFLQKEPYKRLSASALNLQKAALFVSMIYNSAISYKVKRLSASALNLVLHSQFPIKKMSANKSRCRGNSESTLIDKGGNLTDAKF